MTASHFGRFCSGNTAPDRKIIGWSTSVMTIWKLSMRSMRVAAYCLA